MNDKTVLNLQGMGMYELPRTIPDMKMLLALAPEELGSTQDSLSNK